MALCATVGPNQKLVTVCGKLLADAGGEEWKTCLTVNNGAGNSKCYRMKCLPTIDATIAGYSADATFCDECGDVNDTYELLSVDSCSWGDTDLKCLGCAVRAETEVGVTNMSVEITSCVDPTDAGKRLVYLLGRMRIGAMACPGTGLSPTSGYPHQYYKLIDTVTVADIVGINCMEVTGSHTLNPQDEVVGAFVDHPTNPICGTTICTNTASVDCYGWCPDGYSGSTMTVDL